MSDLWDQLRFVFKPSYWMMLNPFSKSWDDQLNELMQTEYFIRETMHTAKIGGVVVWISNHPYCSFTPHRGPNVRPSRATIERAHEKFVTDTLRRSVRHTKPTQEANA